MRQIILVLGLLNFAICSATEQIGDQFIFENDTFIIQSPFDNYENNELSKKISKLNYPIISSGCWRGVIYTWTISNDSLFVIGAVSGIDNKKVDLKYLFNIKTDKYFCSWFRGKINFSSKRVICQNIHWHEDSNEPQYIYDYENEFEILNGKVVYHHKFDNSKTQIGKFDNLESVYTWIQISLTDIPEIEIPLAFDMSFKNDSVGKLTDIEIYGLSDIKVQRLIKDELNKFNGLPVYFKHGQLLQNNYNSRFEIQGIINKKER